MDGHVVVRVEEGLLKGRTTKTVYGNDYVSFQGVPYAKPPVGPLRFKVSFDEYTRMNDDHSRIPSTMTAYRRANVRVSDQSFLETCHLLLR